MAVLISFVSAESVFGHGFAGDRFFPPTVTTDDPFAADELALPTLSLTQTAATDDSPRSKIYDAGFEFDKLIFPHLSIGVSDMFEWVKPQGEPSTKGWQNVELSIKYEVLVSAKHEAIISIGLKADVGSTGNHHGGADSFSTVTPTIYFGKGMGDLPDALAEFRPLAVTGSFAEEFPQRAANANAFDYNFAMYYDLRYLETHVTQLGLPEPTRSMIPIIEYAGSTTGNRGPSVTTGTVAPGVLWETKYCQLGVEALIPINRDSGSHIGGVVQVWWYLDDICPKLFGHPIFGGEQ